VDVGDLQVGQRPAGRAAGERQAPGLVEVVDLRQADVKSSLAPRRDLDAAQLDGSGHRYLEGLGAGVAEPGDDDWPLPREGRQVRERDGERTVGRGQLLADHAEAHSLEAHIRPCVEHGGAQRGDQQGNDDTQEVGPPRGEIHAV